jgi:hypothetical protein
MAITKPPKKPTPPIAAAPSKVDEAALARIVAGAPDATPEERRAVNKHTRKMAGHQAQITFALPPELLDRVDNMAESLSISRAAFIKQALTRAVNAIN